MLILVLKFQEQVDGLAVSGLVWETSRVYFPFDGGVPVILHSIVCPVGRNPRPLTRSFSHPAAAHPHICKGRLEGIVQLYNALCLAGSSALWFSEFPPISMK